ncbi:hypothetical protein K438DRAFT_1761523 [Mycena galopus ATCC 62051]|nr:hypothetical protein K438DRAFT_1761523 [Mycena galopus ATCC 62051]
MFSKTLFIVFAAAASVHAAAIARQAQPPVFTATRIYQTITDVPPYIVDATTTRFPDYEHRPSHWSWGRAAPLMILCVHSASLGYYIVTERKPIPLQILRRRREKFGFFLAPQGSANLSDWQDGGAVGQSQ